MPSRPSLFALAFALCLVPVEALGAEPRPPLEGAVDGEVLDVDGVLYEVRDGKLIPLDEAHAKAPLPAPPAVDAQGPVPPEVPAVSATASRVDVSRIPISPADIERVEVVRGPMSALYGSEAMGGVIHIVTKRPSCSVHASVGASARLSEAGLRSEALGAHVSGAQGPLLYRLSLSGLLEQASDRAGREQASGVIVERPDGQINLPRRRQGTAAGEIGVFFGDDWLVRAFGSAALNEVERRVARVSFREHSTDAQLRLGTSLEGDLLPGHPLASTSPCPARGTIPSPSPSARS